MSRPPRPSPRLARALAAECAALDRERARLEDRRDRLRDALAGAEAELGALEERRALLERLGPAPRPAPRPATVPAPPGAACDARPGRPLRGAAVRETAVRLLAHHPAGAAPIHHRDWHALLADAGFRVVGKDPLAVFLTQVTRSPLVRRAGGPGHYTLDRDAPGALRRRLAEQHDALRRHVAAPAERDALLAAIARTERALEEALRSLRPLGDGAALTAAAG